MEFLNGEVRYNSLKRANPARAEKLFAKNAEVQQGEIRVPEQADHTVWY